MKLLFVADPLESFKPSKDSTLAMMAAAQAAGHQIYHAKASSLSWDGEAVNAITQELQVDRNEHPWFVIKNEQSALLKSFDAVLMRQDPPFDGEFLANTWLLTQAEREGARIFNSPTALR